MPGGAATVKRTYTRFGPWLQQQLDERHLSPAALAGPVDVAQSTAYQWAGGRRLPSQPLLVERIAAVLQVAQDTVWEVIEAEGVEGAVRPSAEGIAPADRPFAVWVRAELATRGWMSAVLARQLGVDADTTRAWRTGRCPPALRHVPRLAAVLGVPIEAVHAVWQRSRASHNHTRSADGRSALSAVELAILRAVRDGATDAEIGAERGRSARTVKNQIVAIRMKLGAVNRPQMVALAFRRGALR